MVIEFSKDEEDRAKIHILGIFVEEFWIESENVSKFRDIYLPLWTWYTEQTFPVPYATSMLLIQLSGGSSFWAKHSQLLPL